MARRTFSRTLSNTKGSLSKMLLTILGHAKALKQAKSSRRCERDGFPGHSGSDRGEEPRRCRARASRWPQGRSGSGREAIRQEAPADRQPGRQGPLGTPQAGLAPPTNSFCNPHFGVHLPCVLERSSIDYKPCTSYHLNVVPPSFRPLWTGPPSGLPAA
jgi:hypothetical protein